MKNEIIISRTNQRLQHFKKLIASREYRYEHREYVIEGLRALDGVRELKEVLVREGTPIPAITSPRVSIVSSEIFSSIAATEHSQGVLAIAGFTTLNARSLRKSGCYVLLDRLQDPGNMGTIARVCSAFALQGLIVTPGCVDPFSPKVVRAAAGALNNLDVITISSVEELQGYTLIAADARGNDVGCFSWPAGYILAIGNEAGGLSTEVRQHATATVAVPIEDCMESLNAAVSAGILLYCATRPQR